MYERGKKCAAKCPGGGGVLPIVGYTGRLRPKGVPFLKGHSHAVIGDRSPGSTPYSGLYGEAPPERDTFLRSQYVKG